MYQLAAPIREPERATRCFTAPDSSLLSRKRQEVGAWTSRGAKMTGLLFLDAA
jgi:hypothetical protein